MTKKNQTSAEELRYTISFLNGERAKLINVTDLQKKEMDRLRVSLKVATDTSDYLRRQSQIVNSDLSNYIRSNDNLTEKNQLLIFGILVLTIPYVGYGIAWLIHHVSIGLH